MTLTNSFHGTEYNTNKSESEIRRIYDGIYQDTLTPSEKQWVRRVKKALCGIDGCTCGNDLGER